MALPQGIVQMREGLEAGRRTARWRRALSGINGRFVKGFETADRRGAQALLAPLVPVRASHYR
ncbi:hypothetical protein WJ36_25465 [Burkholderia ubonensis]|uniref:hypothetical protein n=1 Tax=Burkholderia ubonensis TaxID=101571 RepID=UPI00075D714D|nr:hypothetical protein [Burkholderia ubonensis]KVG89051.1 hypothetical protein WJ36_25465 [Burkholderia ubonensis]